jgi:hypothetical protein
LPFDKPARRLEEFGAQTKKRRKRVKKENIGSCLDSLLGEEGTYEQVSATAIKCVLARQVEAAMKKKHRAFPGGNVSGGRKLGRHKCPR